MDMEGRVYFSTFNTMHFSPNTLGSSRPLALDPGHGEINHHVGRGTDQAVYWPAQVLKSMLLIATDLPGVSFRVFEGCLGVLLTHELGS